MEDTPRNLNEALEKYVALTPEKPFIHHRDRDYTYLQVGRMVDGLASFFAYSGVVAGDKVCIMLPRTPELIIAFLASTKIGVLPVPVNYLLVPEMVVDFIRSVGPKVIISSASLVPERMAFDFDDDSKILKIDIEGELPNWLDWETTVSCEQKNQLREISSFDSIAYQNFTTGSTGHPKGALASHENIYWNTRSLVEKFAIEATDVHLCMFGSFAHPHELFARPLYTGGSLVLLQEINPRTIINTINKYSVTCMMGLAPMYEAMATHCSHLSVDSLRIVESGGMYTRVEVNEKFTQAFDRPILSVWGSTETSGVAVANSPDDFHQDGSMGKVCPYYDVKVMTDAVEAGPGEVGELLFKGPGVVSGYDGYGALVDDDGWYRSGDLVRVDEGGYFYFVERKSGMLKIAGMKIYPLQVENILLTHPDIVEAAILGVDDKRRGTVPKAFLAVSGGKTIDAGDLFDFCKPYLPTYMIPRQVEILESLPKVGSGKINKKEILELYINKRKS